LPFSLLNLAGWMVEPLRKGSARLDDPFGELGHHTETWVRSGGRA
jgi:hypothetical protein